MKRCIISHEVPEGGGRFTVFQSGLDYPDSETTGREKYFEESPPNEADSIDWDNVIAWEDNPDGLAEG